MKDLNQNICNLLKEEVQGKSSIVIAGHIRPDGDCVGSCTALYNYLKQKKESYGIQKIDVYLEPFGQEFNILEGTGEIHHDYESDMQYDLFISLDCASIDRLGNALKYFNTAKKTLNIDHHVSNTSFAMTNHVVSNASSTCEVLFDLFEQESITKEIAECLYIGIIHDTGVFKYTSTSEKTMKIAGTLINKGIDFPGLIDETFYGRTYMQTQILGRCLLESVLFSDGRIIAGSINRTEMDFYGATHADLNGVIDQLRMTKGTEGAIFIYEVDPGEYKVSMRSNGKLNVSKIAQYFGGGGHIKAAGCTICGSSADVFRQIVTHMEIQLKEIQESEFE